MWWLQETVEFIPNTNEKAQHITEQRVRNVFFDGKENNSNVLFFIIFLYLNSILIWLCPTFRTRFHVYIKSNVKMFLIFCRDHKFDCGRQPVKRKFKFGNISEPMAPSRGALDLSFDSGTETTNIVATKRVDINI